MKSRYVLLLCLVYFGFFSFDRVLMYLLDSEFIFVESGFDCLEDSFVDFWDVRLLIAINDYLVSLRRE